MYIMSIFNLFKQWFSNAPFPFQEQVISGVDALYQYPAAEPNCP